MKKWSEVYAALAASVAAEYDGMVDAGGAPARRGGLFPSIAGGGPWSLPMPCKPAAALRAASSKSMPYKLLSLSFSLYRSLSFSLYLKSIPVVGGRLLRARPLLVRPRSEVDEPLKKSFMARNFRHLLKMQDLSKVGVFEDVVGRFTTRLKLSTAAVAGISCCRN